MKLITAILLCFTLNQATAQKNTFDLSLLAGLNFSELEGEGLGDYFGLNAGIKADYQFAKKWQIATELLYSENGEYLLPDFYPQNIDYGKISLKHLEIPIHLNFLIDLFKKNAYDELQLEFGVAYAKLFDYKAENSFGEPLTEQIVYSDDEAWLHQMGLTYFFNAHLGLSSRISFPIGVTGLTPTLAARLVYML